MQDLISTSSFIPDFYLYILRVFKIISSYN